MNIWIFQTGEPLPCDNDGSRPMRAINLSESLVKKGHSVRLISSRFYHQKKSHRNDPYSFKISENLVIDLIDSPGYNSHKGLSRLYDHYILSQNLSSFLQKSKEKPDIIFVGFPPIRSAYVLSKWAVKNKIPYLVDIKDKWPDIFIERLPRVLKILAKIPLIGLFKNQRRILKNSTGIVTNSEGFLQWSLKKINRERKVTDFVAPLSSPDRSIGEIENEETEKFIEKLKIRDSKDQLLIFYSGVISEAFDCDVIVQSMKELESSDINYKFIIAGDGPQKEDFQIKVKEFKDNIVFCGWVNGAQLQKLLMNVDVGIAPYSFKDNYSLSLTNKTIDYLKYGLPILLPELGYVSSFLSEKKICLVYNRNNSLADHVIRLKTDDSLLKELSTNSKNLFNDEFEYKTIYNGLVEHIENIVIQKKKNEAR